MDFKEEIITFWNLYSHQNIRAMGKIECKCGNDYECEINLWQLKNGKLKISIQSTGRLIHDSDYLFIGIINETQNLVDRQIKITKISLNYDFNNNSTNYYFGQVDGIVSIFNTPEPTDKYISIFCELSNFSQFPPPIKFIYNEFSIEIGCRNGIDHYIAQSLSNPAILGYLKILSTKPLSQKEWEEFTSHICNLLSLAHRNYITITSMALFSNPGGKFDNALIYALSGVKSTKATNHPLIKKEELQTYLQVSLSKLPKVNYSWNLSLSLDYYFQAMDNASGWPIGAELVIALECLVSAYVNNHINKEFYFENMDNFESKLSKVSEDILKQFEKLYPEQTNNIRNDKNIFNSWENSIKNLNRRSFKQKIKELLNELNIKDQNSDVLQKYIDIRNDLIHYGFPKSSNNYTNDLKVIWQMAEFIETIYVKILGYDGPKIKMVGEYIHFKYD